MIKEWKLFLFFYFNNYHKDLKKKLNVNKEFYNRRARKNKIVQKEMEQLINKKQRNKVQSKMNYTKQLKKIEKMISKIKNQLKQLQNIDKQETNWQQQKVQSYFIGIEREEQQIKTFINKLRLQQLIQEYLESIKNQQHILKRFLLIDFQHQFCKIIHQQQLIINHSQKQILGESFTLNTQLQAILSKNIIKKGKVIGLAQLNSKQTIHLAKGNKYFNFTLFTVFMGQCTSQGKNQQLVEIAKRIIEKEGYTIIEIKDGKTEEKIIPNKVFIVSKENKKYAFKIRYFKNQLDNQGISAQVGILCDLSHPNFIHFLKHFIKNHMFFFLMDYYPLTLRLMIHDGKQITQQQRYRYALEILEGHTHRELKTQNVMISPDDKIIICEFGLEFDSDIHKKKQETSSTSDKWYLAPEIKQKTESIYYQQSKQTDIWAIGVIIAELFGFKYASAICQNEQLETIFSKLCTPNYHECFQDIEQSIRTKIIQMLNPNPDKRAEIQDYLAFFQQKYDEIKSN